MTKYSIVILTFNRAKILPLALRSAIEQTVPPKEYEIIVIDDESRDNTQEVVTKFAKEHAEWNIIYHRTSHGGEARGRNIGTKLARGEFVFFTDDDCIVPPNWIEHFAKIYARRPDIGGVGGFQTSPPALLAKSKYNLLVDYKMFFYGARDLVDQCSSNFVENNGVGNTANMSYRKNVIIEAGGFDERQDFSGSVDFELKIKVMNRGWPLYYTPLAVFHLKEYRSLKELFKLGIIRQLGTIFYCKKNSDVNRMNFATFDLKKVMAETVKTWKDLSPAIAFYNFVHVMGRWAGWRYSRIRGWRF